uniref:Uncharacterized protein n=1 Tax=Fagus sylvatica TaxID=28930 RepID=A0A2N9IJI0_FAGSY
MPRRHQLVETYYAPLLSLEGTITRSPTASIWSRSLSARTIPSAAGAEANPSTTPVSLNPRLGACLYRSSLATNDLVP